MDNRAYEKHMSTELLRYESVCRHCGTCCGAGNDPCEHLSFDDGRSFCKVYENRLGPQKTVSGKFFTCVMIRHNIKTGFYSQECAYTNRNHVS